jgi:hypothetical protein
MLVAIAGPDGVGKTTTTHELVRALAREGLPAIRLDRFAFLFRIPARGAEVEGPGGYGGSGGSLTGMPWRVASELHAAPRGGPLLMVACPGAGLDFHEARTSRILCRALLPIICDFL